MGTFLDQLREMLLSEDGDIRAQGDELLGCLDGEQRYSVALSMLQPGSVRWRQAARCVLPDVLSETRLRMFAVRCAQYRLERERASGREPQEWAWNAVEVAEQLARARRPSHAQAQFIHDVERDVQEYVCNYEYEGQYWTEPLGEAMVDIEQIPSDWPARSLQAGESLNASVLLQASLDTDLADFIEVSELAFEAAWSAAQCLSEVRTNMWGELQDIFLPARTMEEWRWQRRAWEVIVIGGGDGAALVWAAAPAGATPPGDA
ncbi:MAG: hypothetical protein AAFV53_01575 [Myxococcota bacterium]